MIKIIMKRMIKITLNHIMFFEKEVEDESGQKQKSENWRNGICSTSSYELG